jgi:hypothetical protein
MIFRFSLKINDCMIEKIVCVENCKMSVNDVVMGWISECYRNIAKQQTNNDFTI